MTAIEPPAADAAPSTSKELVVQADATPAGPIDWIADPAPEALRTLEDLAALVDARRACIDRGDATTDAEIVVLVGEAALLATGKSEGEDDCLTVSELTERFVRAARRTNIVNPYDEWMKPWGSRAVITQVSRLAEFGPGAEQVRDQMSYRTNLRLPQLDDVTAQALNETPPDPS